MSSCLLAEQSINPPAAIDGEINTVLIEKLYDLDHIVCRHFRIVVSHLALWPPMLGAVIIAKDLHTSCGT